MLYLNFKRLEKYYKQYSITVTDLFAQLTSISCFHIHLPTSTPPEVILECIREILEEDMYRNNTERLRRLAGELKGPNAVREMIEEEVSENIY